MGASSLPFDKKQLSEQHTAHRIKFRNYKSKFSNFVLIDSIRTRIQKKWHLLESFPQTKYLQQQASMKFPTSKSLKCCQMTYLQIRCLQLLEQHIQPRYQIPKFWGIQQLKFRQIKFLQPVENLKQEL